jgi:hypothetical protein
MKLKIGMLCVVMAFVQCHAKNTVSNNELDPVALLMANSFAQILAHGIAAAQAGNNKELRVQELSVAIQCAAQFMVQFFNTPKTRALYDNTSLMHSVELCLEDEEFMQQLAAAFGQEAPMIASLMRSRAYEQGLTTVWRSDRLTA